MGFFNKLKTALNTSKAEEDAIDSSYTESIINEIENIPFALSGSNVMYAGLSELAGYHYFNTVIVGTFNIKTHKGAQLKMVGDDFELKLNSDMVELESDFSNTSNRSITKTDFEINENDLPKIAKSKIKSLELSAKKEQVIFSIIDIEKIKEEE